MNARIQELEDQALEHPDLYSYDKERFLEIFAELIIRECANQVSRESEALSILEHFGVEESQGWVCPKCGMDRTKAACPKGHTAALTGECPMYGVAQ